MNRIDSTMDDLANTKFLTLYSAMARDFVATTSFTNTEVVSLLLVYYKFALANGRKSKLMTKQQLQNLFMVLFRIADISIIDRILLKISKDVKFISPEAWINLFTYYFSNSIEKRMEFTFNVYTMSGTVILNREIVGLAVEKFFEGTDDDEIFELRSDMCDFIFQKFDNDKDGVITYDEYANIVVKQPALMEFLGSVFPDANNYSLIATCLNMESMFLYE